MTAQRMGVDDLLRQVQGALGLQGLETDSAWPVIAAQAMRSAQADIYRIFARQGYSRAQIDTWDDFNAYFADQALYWALVRGGAAKDVEPRLLLALDRRGDLKEATLTAGGELVRPAIGPTRSGTTDGAQDWFSLADDDLQEWYTDGRGPAAPPSFRP